VRRNKRWKYIEWRKKARERIIYKESVDKNTWMIGSFEKVIPTGIRFNL
jgi:hypothetical protein